MESEVVISDINKKHQKELVELRDSLEEEHERKLSSLEQNHTTEIEQLKLSLSPNGKDTSGESGQGESDWSESERAEHQTGWEDNREAEKEDLARLEDELTDLKSHQLEQLENVSVAIKVKYTAFQVVPLSQNN